MGKTYENLECSHPGRCCMLRNIQIFARPLKMILVCQYKCDLRKFFMTPLRKKISIFFRFLQYPIFHLHQTWRCCLRHDMCGVPFAGSGLWSISPAHHNGTFEELEMHLPDKETQHQCPECRRELQKDMQIEISAPVLGVTENFREPSRKATGVLSV